MKTLTLLTFGVLIALFLSAQNPSPIPELNKKLTEYYNSNPIEKISLVCDKLQYKPGETIWFSAFVTDAYQHLESLENKELFVKLFDKKGILILQDIFHLDHGLATGDMLIPEDLPKDVYFLTAHTAAMEISAKVLSIDPEYSDQWIVKTHLKDSISVAGQKNEISLTISDLSGEIQKNDQIRYQFMNGAEILEKGKLKTDEKGKAVIPFTLPAKSNGEPFICKLSDKSDEWRKEIFLPTNLDQVIIRFFPEGGNLNAGIPAKVGFTAFNKWGIPVDVEGSLVNQDGKPVTMVKSFVKGLGLFSIMNDGNQKYKLVLSGNTAPTQSFDLPAPKPDGLSLSVLKPDAGFIPANLVFADKQKHAIALAITSGSQLNWAADMEINGIGRIKIPDETLPNGINLLSVFSIEGQLLAERIILVDKKQLMKIEVVPEKNKIQSGESMKVKVRMTDENDQPLNGNVTVSVSDKFRNDVAEPSIENCSLTGPEMETPYSLISGAMKGRASNSVLMDTYLIANHLKGFDWEKIRSFKPDNDQNVTAKAKDSEAHVSDLLPGNFQKFSMINTDQPVDKTYFNNNPELFRKTPPKVKLNTTSLENQRRLLSSSTSLMDIIKILKPYHLTNNQIVFNGTENSLNFQGGALFVIDGQQLGTDISAIAGISPLGVDHINISTNTLDIHRYTGFNTVGVIEIFMKNAKTPEPSTTKEITAQYKDGFRVPNEFQAVEATGKNKFNTTLLWIQDEKVDESGQFELVVTAGKVITDFIIEVQGVSLNGRMGSSKADFSVKK